MKRPLLLLAGLALISSFAPAREKLELGKEYPKPGEAEEFRRFAREINEIQEKLAGENPIGRAFHQKAHGCLKGTFTVLDSRPDAVKAGVLAEAKSYDAWVRFSNAKGKSQPDTKRDLRGLAVKLVNAGGSGVSQDFLMTNGPVHFAKDAAMMMDFAKAGAGGFVSMAWFFLRHPKAAKIILRDSGKEVASMTQETYWSRVPILFGTQAAKFNASPCAPDGSERPEHPSKDYLTEDLRERAGRGEICFDFNVQLQKDADKQPIEDASVEWKESDTPSVRVAQIRLPKQSFDSAEQASFCEGLSFTPWHNLPEHRPLGNMDRARKDVYDSSATFRTPGRPLREPDGTEKF